MLNQFKNIFNSNKNVLFSFISCLILLSILLFINSTINIKNTFNNYDLITDKLTSANSNLSEAINNLSIDADLACIKLEESSKILEDVSTTLLTIDGTYSNDETFLYIAELVDKTSDLYDLSLALISNPSDIQDIDKIEKLSTYLDECKLLYSKLQSLGIDIELSNDTQTFFENTINYANTIITLNRDNDIKDAATKDFLLKLDAFSKPLKNMSQDLIPAVKKIREDKRSFDPLLDDIIEKKKTLEDIKNKLNLLSIPEDCVHFYNYLNDTLVLYDKYIVSLQNAILFETSCNGYEKNKSSIDKKYTNAISKYNDMMNSYNNYKKLFNY